MRPDRLKAFDETAPSSSTRWPAGLLLALMAVLPAVTVYIQLAVILPTQRETLEEMQRLQIQTLERKKESEVHEKQIKVLQRQNLLDAAAIMTEQGKLLREIREQKGRK